MELTLSATRTYGATALKNVFKKRLTTENYYNPFKQAVVGEKEYTIIYNMNLPESVSQWNGNRLTSFGAGDIVLLQNAEARGYTFLGWYDNEYFWGSPITGWSAGDCYYNVELWAKWELPLGGKGVYSYTVNIDEISTDWAGTPKYPAFSIILLTDDQLADCIAAESFYQATENEPEYQISVHSNMRADTSVTGNSVVFGERDFQAYYTGVAATVTGNTFTVTVDMAKLEKRELYALYHRNSDGEHGQYISSDDTVDLTGYKPYVLALGSQENDADNFEMHVWNADLMKMKAGATFPNGKLQHPTFTFHDLSRYGGSLGSGELINNTFEFVPYYVDGDWFYFKDESGLLYVGGAYINSLNTPCKLSSGGSVDFADGVLEAGKEYIVTLIVEDDYSAYVVVTEKESDEE